MLYNKICKVALSLYAFLPSPIYGSTYYVSSNPSDNYQCPSDITSCHIYCDVAESITSNIYNCDNAQNCYFHCDELKCGINAAINATNAHILTITQASNGQECMHSTSITAPHNGSAYLTTHSKKGFKSMNVYAGPNTKEIIIDTTSGQDDAKEKEYELLNVYASTADYLRISIGPNLHWIGGTIQCPIDSSYNGPDIAPCMIDATNGTIKDATIIAPDGTPKNVYIEGCNDCNNIQLICDSGVSAYPFNTLSQCWWTTIHPTTNPTKDPTFQPTMPTHEPTVDPTINPTMNPSLTPSYVSTVAPLLTPSIEQTQPPSPNNLDNYALISTVIIIIGIVLIVLLVSILAFLYVFSRRKRKLKQSPIRVQSEIISDNQLSEHRVDVYDVDAIEAEDAGVLKPGDEDAMQMGTLVSVQLVSSMSGTPKKAFPVNLNELHNAKAKLKKDPVVMKDVEKKASEEPGVSDVAMSFPSSTFTVADDFVSLSPNTQAYKAFINNDEPHIVGSEGVIRIKVSAKKNKEESDTDSSESDGLWDNNDKEMKQKEEEKEKEEEDIIDMDDNNGNLYDMAMAHMSVTPADAQNKEQVQERKDGVEQVRIWMENVVNLNEYTELLIMHGYDDMNSLMEVTLEDLEKMGIQKIGHRRKIFKFTSMLASSTMDANDVQRKTNDASNLTKSAMLSDKIVSGEMSTTK